MDIRENHIKNFWSHVDKKEEDSCWLWTAAKNDDGYGIFTLHYGFGRKKKIVAHRLSYALAYGNLPTEWCLHKCDNPACVNPKHLYDGTPRQNVQDSYDRNRRRTQKGSNSLMSSFTEQKIKEIRELYKNHYYKGLGKDLAEKYGVSKSTISYIVNNITYNEEKM